MILSLDLMDSQHLCMHRINDYFHWRESRLHHYQGLPQIFFVCGFHISKHCVIMTNQKWFLATPAEFKIWVPLLNDFWHRQIFPKHFIVGKFVPEIHNGAKFNRHTSTRKYALKIITCSKRVRILSPKSLTEFDEISLSDGKRWRAENSIFWAQLLPISPAV